MAFNLLYCLLLLPALLALPFVLGPILIRFVHRQAEHPVFKSLDPLIEPLPAEADRYLRKSITSLQMDGFALLAVRVQTGFIKNLTAYVAFIENRHAGDMAMLVTIYLQAAGQDRLHAAYTEFSNSFLDGHILTVNNCSQLTAAAPVPNRTVHQFVTLRDLRRLYRVYRALVQRSSHGERKALPKADELERFLGECMERECAAQLKAGYFIRDESEECYYPTWKGAALMSWKLAWPVSAIRCKERDRRAEELLRELGV